MDFLYRFLLILLAILFVIVCVLLRKHKKISSLTLFILSLSLLIWKTHEFAINITKNSTFPLEFSHISYFVVGIICVIGIKSLYLFASSSVFISGVGYYLTFLINPSIMFETMKGNLLTKAIISHSILLFIGILLFLDIKKFKFKEYIFTLIGFLIIYIYGYLGLTRVIFKTAVLENYVFMNFLSGYYLSYITKTVDNPLILKILFVIFTYLVLSFVSLGIYYLNKKFSRDADSKINGLMTFKTLLKKY